MPIRWVDEWDNPDGSIERGYAGRSIFFEGGNVRDDLKPVAEYARLLASVGINGCNINNVNAAPQLLDTAKNRPYLTPDLLAHAVAPEAVADIIAYLVSDAAAPVSGAIVPAYGP